MASIEQYGGLYYGWDPITENYAAQMDLNLIKLGIITRGSAESVLNDPPPPVRPTFEGDFDRYRFVNKAWIVGPNPTGLWSGHADEIAVSDNKSNNEPDQQGYAWNFTKPTEGLVMYVSNINSFMMYTTIRNASYDVISTQWVAVASGGGGGGGSGTINSGENLGSGKKVYAQVSGDKLQMRTLVAGSNVTLTETATEIKIDAASATQDGIKDGANKALLSPDNHNIFLAKNGDKLEFSSLKAGENTTITSDKTNGTVTINSTQPNVDSFVVDGENTGDGTTLFKSKLNKKLQIKTIKSGAGISVTNDDDTVTISSTGGGSLPDNVITGGLNDHESQSDPISGKEIQGILKDPSSSLDKNTLVFKGISAGNGIVIEDVVEQAGGSGYGLLRISAEQTVPTVNVSSASYTLKAEDAGKCLERNSSSPTTIIVPSGTFYASGTMIYICQVGVGAVTIQAGAGVTIRSPSGLTLQGQYSHVSLRLSSYNTWYLTFGLSSSTKTQSNGLIDIVAVTGSSHTLSTANIGKCIETDRPTDVIVFVTSNANDPIPIGSTFLIRQMGIGKTTITAQPGVTIRNPHGTFNLSKQYASVSLHKRGLDEWCIEGNLSEV